MRQVASSSFVLVWQTVTVAFAFIISMASGFPTTRLRPTMVTRFPVTSMSFAFKISMTASAVQGA